MPGYNIRDFLFMRVDPQLHVGGTCRFIYASPLSVRADFSAPKVPLLRYTPFSGRKRGRILFFPVFDRKRWSESEPLERRNLPSQLIPIIQNLQMDSFPITVHGKAAPRARIFAKFTPLPLTFIFNKK
jgi:hypothetical protein